MDSIQGIARGGTSADFHPADPLVGPLAYSKFLPMPLTVLKQRAIIYIPLPHCIVLHVVCTKTGM